MLTQENQETLRHLVQHVSRAFYEARFTIILDQLSRNVVLKDDDLAARMGLQPKELNKIIAVLHNDSLVRIYRQNELKEGAQRAVGRAYYYIDYEHFCNVVKWRITKMHRKIDSTLRNELDNKGYICSLCSQSYTPLDIDKILDMMTGAMVCESCHGEVVDHENAENVQGSKDRMQRFHHQMRFIRKGLKESEEMILPAFDVAAWVKTHLTDPAALKAAAASSNSSSGPGAGLKVAGSDPNAATQDNGIGVIIANDKDEATRRQERNQEAEAKRVMNALPAWHLKSTISGDLTALGIREAGRVAEMQAQLQPLPGDDILKGLGIVGASGQQSKTPQQQIPLLVMEEDVKPVVQQDDYYDRYYASLAASSSAPTPTSAVPEIELEMEEEEEKPSVKYLDSLGDYRKRARVDDVDDRIAKFPRMEAIPAPVIAEQVAIEPPPQEGMELDDPMVFVNGQAKMYSEVTDDDHELMSADEYQAYFEVVQARM